MVIEERTKSITENLAERIHIAYVPETDAFALVKHTLFPGERSTSVIILNKREANEVAGFIMSHKER